MVTLSQIVEEEKGLVFDDWPTDSSTKFVNLLNSFCKRRQVRNPARDCVTTISLENRVISIQRRILSIVITRAVKLVGPRLDRGADNRPRSAAYFCRRNTGCDLELGDRIRVRKHSNRAKLWLVVVDSVEREIIIRWALTVDY